MSDFPWMPFYGDRFFGSEDVLTMSDTEIRCYLQLLWAQWKKGSIPSEPERLAKICGLSKGRFKTIWKKLAPKFELRGDERLVNPVQEGYRNHAGEVRKSYQERGAKGGSAKAAAEAEQDLSQSLVRAKLDLSSSNRQLHKEEASFSEGADALGKPMLKYGGKPPRNATPIHCVLCDEEDQQEWISESGHRWVRIFGQIQDMGSYHEVPS